MRVNNIPVDLEIVKKIVEKNRKSSTDNKIHSLSKEFKIKIGNYYKEINVVGGIDVNIYDNYNLLEKKYKENYTLDINTELIQLKIEEVNKKLKGIELTPFPFQPEQYCLTCAARLNQIEMSYCQKEMFCVEHNPIVCQICFHILIGEYLNINGDSYHLECFTCSLCFKKLESSYIEYNYFYAHQSCAQKEKRKQYQNSALSLVKSLKRRFNLNQCKEALSIFKGNKDEAVIYLLSKYAEDKNNMI